MARIIIYSHACTFSQGNGFRCMQYKPMDEPLEKRVVDCATIEQIDAELEGMKNRVGDTHKESFFVSAMLARGERAPRGYRKRNFKLEVDRDA